MHVYNDIRFMYSLWLSPLATVSFALSSTEAKLLTNTFGSHDTEWLATIAAEHSANTTTEN